MKKTIIFGLSLIIFIFLFGCTDSTQIANPASQNCINMGGSLKIQNNADGQVGMCTLPDGKVCEEWALYRGECNSTKCGECPMLTPPSPNFCPNGKIVAGEKDKCGCPTSPKCEAIACTMDAKVCPDGSYVGRVPPNCEFAPCPNATVNNTGQNITKNYCPDITRGKGSCTMEYKPVCGWFKKNIQCIKYPCAVTESNACTACQNENVEYWTEGVCPK